MPAIEAPHESPEEKPEAGEQLETTPSAVESAFTPVEPRLELDDNEGVAPANEALVLPPGGQEKETPTVIYVRPEPSIATVTRHVVTLPAPSAPPVQPKGGADVAAETSPMTDILVNEKAEEGPSKKPEVVQAACRTNESSIKLDNAAPQSKVSVPPTRENRNDSEQRPKDLPEPREDKALPAESEKPQDPGTATEDAEANVEEVSPEEATGVREGPVKEPKTLFLEVTHVPVVAEEVADTLKAAECGIVVLETFGYNSSREQQEVGEAHTSLISSERLREIQRNPQGEVAQETTEILADSEMDMFTRILLSNLMGTDMQFMLIDLTEDHPDYPLAAAMRQSTMKLKGARAIHASNSKLRELLRVNIQTWSASSTAREAYMTAQLKEIRQQYPDTKIGVVKGAVHTSISHAIAAEEGQIERKFIKPEHTLRKSHIEKERFSYGEQASRELHFFPEKELDEKLLDRALLEYIFVEYVKKAENPLFFRVENALDFIDRLSDEEVVDVLDKIDDIKKHSSSILEWIRIETKIEELLIKLSEE
jgi:hypothetical protein